MLLVLAGMKTKRKVKMFIHLKNHWINGLVMHRIKRPYNSLKRVFDYLKAPYFKKTRRLRTKLFWSYRTLKKEKICLRKKDIVIQERGVFVKWIALLTARAEEQVTSMIVPTRSIRVTIGVPYHQSMKISFNPMSTSVSAVSILQIAVVLVPLLEKASLLMDSQFRLVEAVSLKNKFAA
jgi:hypothetical protein